MQKGDCCLCGKKGSKKHINGIDKIDWTQWYTIENIQICCTECNFMKGKLSMRQLQMHYLRVTMHNRELLRQYKHEADANGGVPIIPDENDKKWFNGRSSAQGKVDGEDEDNGEEDNRRKSPRSGLRQSSSSSSSSSSIDERQAN